MMTPQRWQQVKQLLGPALELDPSQRNDYLNKACENDSALREDVERLLAAEQKAGTEFLKDVILPPKVAAYLREHNEAWIGRQLGPYQIVEQIGVGGMGEVYRAMRADDQYRKQVAIKLVRSGQDSSFAVSRFKNERQILAGLDHPNIARLLDGGTTEEGLPYFVMELIEGQRIDDYCNRQNLATDERLELFLQVCSAVQYAHQRLIIHRDIKPGNVLVTSEGIPKLLDFGIAKLLEFGPEADQPVLTIGLIRLLTPEYASPEQVRNKTITTASDVYSLGVVLYELLTGHTPYPVPSRAPHEISRAVCEIEPERPSTAVRRTTNSADDRKRRSEGTVAFKTAPATSSDRLSKRLAGDLDNIILMALRKEPHRRYVSAEQFAQDIRRHLANLPVIARADTFLYRSSKFIARHKIGVAATTLATILLLAALAVTVREARIAQRRFNDVRSLANSLIFDVHDSIKDLPGSTPARKLIVDRALQYLDSLSRESGGDLSLQRELATAYERVGLVQGHYLQNSLGDTKGSLLSYEKALSIRKRIAAKSNDWNDRLALAESHRLVANQHWALGDYPRALENSMSAVATSEALNGAHPKDLKILKELGFDYEIAGQIQVNGYAGGGGDPAKVGEYFGKAVATDEILLTISPDDLGIQHAYATDLNHLGSSLAAKDPNAALECYKKELKIDQELRRRSPEARYARGVAVAYSHIGQTYDQLGDSARSIENYTQGLEVSKALVLVDPKNSLFQQGLAIAYANTANELSKMGRNSQSISFIEKSDEIMRTLVASSPQNIQQRGIFASVIAANGTTFMNLGKPDAALKDLDEARATFESLRRTDSPDSGPSIGALSCTEKMGEAALRGRNSKLAAEYFHRVLKEVEPELAKQNVDLALLYLAADSYSGLGDLELRNVQQSHGNRGEQTDGWIQARALYLKSLEAWHQIEHPRAVTPNGFDAGDPVRVDKKLKLCELALANLGAAPRK